MSWRMSQSSGLGVRLHYRDIGIPNDRFPFGRVPFNHTTLVNRTCVACGVGGHEAFHCHATNEMRYYTINNREALLRGDRPRMYVPTEHQMNEFLAANPARRYRNTTPGTHQSYLPPQSQVNAPAVQPLFHTDVRGQYRVSPPRSNLVRNEPYRRPATNYQQTDRPPSRYFWRSNDRRQQDTSQQSSSQSQVPMYDPQPIPVVSQDVRCFSSRPRHGRSPRRQRSHSRDYRRQTSRQRSYQPVVHGSSHRSRSRRSRPIVEPNIQVPIQPVQSSAPRRKAKPVQLEGWEDDITYDGVKIPHERHFPERNRGLEHMLNHEVPSHHEQQYHSYKGIISKLPMQEVPQFEPREIIKPKRESNNLFPTKYEKRMTSWRQRPSQKNLETIEQILKEANAIDDRDQTDSKIVLTQFISSFSGDNQKRLLECFPNVDVSKMVVPDEGMEEVQVPIDEKANSFRETYRRLKALMLNQNRPEITVKILRKFPTLVVRDTFVHYLLRDEHLNRLRITPNILLMEFYASDDFKSVTNRMVKDWFKDPQEVASPSFVTAVRFGPGPTNPVLTQQTTMNLFPNQIPPDNIHYFDTTAKIIHVSRVILYRIADPSWYRISELIHRHNPKAPYISNIGWISLPDGYNGDPNSICDKGYLTNWIPVSPEDAASWGRPERATIDFTKPAWTQFVVGDEILLRIRVQDQVYDIVDPIKDGMPGRPLLISPHFHSRHFGAMGQFARRQYVEEGPIIITGHQKFSDTITRRDARYAGDDVPDDIVFWRVFLAGQSGLREPTTMQTLVVSPQSHQFNLDCVSKGSLGYAEYIPTTYTITQQRAKGIHNEDIMTEVRVPNPPKIIQCVVGPDAWFRAQMWMVPSEASIPFIPEGWRGQRPLYNDMDFLLMMFSKIHCLLTINETWAEEAEVEGLELRVPIEVEHKFPQCRFSFFVPNPRYLPVPEGQENKEPDKIEDPLRTTLSKFGFHIYQPLTLQVITRQPGGQPGSMEFKPAADVGNFHGIVNYIKPCYSSRDEIANPHSEIWNKGELDAVPPSSLYVAAKDVDGEAVPVGRIVTLVVSAGNAMQLISYLSDRSRAVISMKPLFNKKTREAAGKEMCEKRIMCILDRDNPNRNPPQMPGKVAHKIHGMKAPEESVKNTAVHAYLGLPMGPHPMKDPIEPTTKRYKFFHDGEWQQLTENQSSWITAALKKLNAYEVERPAMMLIGPPGSGKSTTIFVLAREILDEKSHTNGQESQARMQIDEDDGTTTRVQEVVCLTATYALCEKAANLQKIGNAQFHKKYPNAQASVWAKGMPYRPVLIRPIDYLGVALPSVAAEQMSINYYMFKDELAPKSVLDARFNHAEKWKEYEEFTRALIRMAPGKLKNDKQKQQKLILATAVQMQDDLYEEVIRVGNFNIIILTFKQGVAYFRQEKNDLGITVLILDEAAYSPDSQTLVTCRLMAQGVTRQLVIAGDPVQLRPVVKARGLAGQLHAVGCMTRLQSPSDIVHNATVLRSKQSVADKLVVAMSNARATLLPYILTDNFRHTEVIGHFTSWTFYKNMVRSGLSEAVQTTKDFALSNLPLPIEGFSMCWLGVRGPETMAAGASLVNEVQIEQAVSLAWLIVVVFRACKGSDLVFLTPYTGTAVYLDDELSKQFEGKEDRPRCKTIDTDQGQEHLVTVLVLVRCRSMKDINEFKEDYGMTCNERLGEMDHDWFYPTYDHNKIENYTVIWFIGFLKLFNRWNVCSSRQKGGFFVLGDPFTTDFCIPAFLLHRWLMENRAYMECGVQTWTRMSLFKRETWYDTKHHLRSVSDMAAIARGRGLNVTLPGYTDGEVSMDVWPAGTRRASDPKPTPRPIKLDREVKSMDTVFPDRTPTSYKLSTFTVYDEPAVRKYRQTYMVPTRFADMNPDEVDPLGDQYESVSVVDDQEQLDNQASGGDQLTVVDLWQEALAEESSTDVLVMDLTVEGHPLEPVKSHYQTNLCATLGIQFDDSEMGDYSQRLEELHQALDPTLPCEPDADGNQVIYPYMEPMIHTEVTSVEQARQDSLNCFEVDWKILSPSGLYKLPYPPELQEYLNQNPVLLQLIGDKWVKTIRYNLKPQELVENMLLQEEIVRLYQTVSGGSFRAAALFYLELWRLKALQYWIARSLKGQFLKNAITNAHINLSKLITKH